MTGCASGTRWRYAVGTPWLVPTVRACRPSLLMVVAVAGLGLVAGLATGARGVALPAEHVRLLAAALAVGVAMPRDQAANLLVALPIGSWHRLAHRTVVTTSVAVVAWVLDGWFVDAVGAPSGSTIGGNVPGLLALVAIAVVAGVRFRTWGACAPLALVAAEVLLDGPEPLADLLGLRW